MALFERSDRPAPGRRPTRPSKRRATMIVSVLLISGSGVIVAAATSATSEAGVTVAAHQRPRPPRPTSTPRPTPTSPPSPTPSPTATSTATPSSSPSPSSTPTPTAAPSSCAAPVVFAGASYCPGYVNTIKSTYYGVGQRIVVDVVVDHVAGSSVQVHGYFWCPPDTYCGAFVYDSMSVTFPTGSALPAYGNMIRLFGVTTPGGLSPNGFVLTGQCEPEWGDC